MSFLRKRCNVNPARGPFHFRAPSKILWKTVRGNLFYHHDYKLYVLVFNQPIALARLSRSSNKRQVLSLYSNELDGYSASALLFFKEAKLSDQLLTSEEFFNSEVGKCRHPFYSIIFSVYLAAFIFTTATLKEVFRVIGFKISLILPD